MTAPPRKGWRPIGLPRVVAQRALELQSDERLVALTRGGSDPAFEAIVRRYRAPLMRYCRRLLPAERAEDIVQQTFINTLGAVREEERPFTLRPWLYRVAHNLTLNAVAKKGFDHEPLDPRYDGVPQPPELVEEKHRLEHVVREIDALPERQRSAVVLRELEGRSYDEIARELEATPAVVRQLLHRARSRLRDTCGVLVPLPLLRALSMVQTPPERIAEVVAGGGAGVGIAKAGATVFAAGVIAAGAGVSVPRHAGTRDHPRAIAEAVTPPTRAAGQGAAAPATQEGAQEARDTAGSGGDNEGKQGLGGSQGDESQDGHRERGAYGKSGHQGGRPAGSDHSDADDESRSDDRRRHSDRDEGEDDEGEGHVAEADADSPAGDGESRAGSDGGSDGPSSEPQSSGSGDAGAGSTPDGGAETPEP